MNWIYIFGGVALIVFFVRWLNAPYYYRNIETDGFARYIKIFIQQFGTGSVLLIKHEGSNKFIQFAKYGDKKNDVLRYGFPCARWSQNYFDNVKKRLVEKNLNVQVQPTGNDHIKSFLEIDFLDLSDGGIDVMVDVARTTFQALAIPDTERYKINFSGARSANYEQEIVERVVQDEKSPIIFRFFAKKMKRNSTMPTATKPSSTTTK